MKDISHYKHLYEIAKHLNKAYSLPAALQTALEKTIELLGVETGWIWLTEPNHKSVYLAASHQLPPALSKHPERLSGWCWCIKQYLSDEMEEAINISEIKCSRLENLSTDTRGLKFHASIPIYLGGQKVGLLNLLTKESRQLDEQELTILNTISELIAAAIERTRLQQYAGSGVEGTSGKKVYARIIHQQLTDMVTLINSGMTDDKELLSKIEVLQKELSDTIAERHETEDEVEFQYPELPLTKRELEVLTLIKQGLTNSKIGEQLYIAERTVKFHVTSILSKLHAKTRTEAVDISLKRGLIKF